jgi:hypothetical protein
MTGKVDTGIVFDVGSNRAGYPKKMRFIKIGGSTPMIGFGSPEAIMGDLCEVPLWTSGRQKIIVNIHVYLHIHVQLHFHTYVVHVQVHEQLLGNILGHVHVHVFHTFSRSRLVTNGIKIKATSLREQRRKGVGKNAKLNL